VGARPLDFGKRLRLTDPSGRRTRALAESYRGKSRCVTSGSAREPVAVAPFGPARTQVIVPSEKPVIHAVA